MDSLNDIMSKLSEDDIAALQAAADAMFGGATGAEEESDEDAPKQQPMGFGGIDPAMLAKISGLMGKMNQKDSKSDLIYALKPHLSPARRKRADEAMQMMKMLELLPTLQQAMGEDKKE